MIGGLPKVRTFPFEYKAPFSPCDVIEEYTRPARYVEKGNIITKPAMSDIELISFEKVGTLEAFNSDGLRSLIYTMKSIPDMKEKTLRYPGHINTIQKLFAAGFFDKEPLNIKGKEISPFDFTTELLYKAWKLEAEEKEFTIMRIIITGKEKGVRKEIIYDLYDEYDEIEKLSSMARTTGFTATAVANMVLNSKFNLKGMFPPELVGKEDGCYEFMMDHLKEREVVLNKTERILES
jgi:saccharopine dehydrogenase-like NADP-dependent oxidoreductase